MTIFTSKHYLLALCAVGLLFVVGCQPPTPTTSTTAIPTLPDAPEGSPDTSEDLRFFLSFIPNVQFAPLYVLQDRGYLADAGYNLTIEYGDENIGVEQIASGDLNFGMISGEQIILARSGERSVVYVYEWFQSYPIALVVPDTVAVSNVSELTGRTIGLPGLFGANYSGLTALLAANDLTESDVALESIGFAAPDVVCAGEVDAAAVYINNEPLQIALRAANGDCGDITGVSVFPVADDVDLVSNGITTSEAVIADNPALVQLMVTGFDRALRDTINNPAEAYLISANVVENLPLSDDLRAALESAAEAQREFLATNPDRAAIATSRDDLYTTLSDQFSEAELIQFHILLETIKLWDADTLGLTEAASWATTQGVLIDIGSLSDPINLSTAYTNDFVPTLETSE